MKDTGMATSNESVDHRDSLGGQPVFMSESSKSKGEWD